MTVLFSGMKLSAFVQGGPDSFEHLSLEEGLSQSIVSVIHKDRRGFMWFGTQSGLNRFDGYSFRIFKHLPFDSTSISGNDISSITENKDGMLWIGTSTAGLNRMNPRTETFTSFRHDPANPNSIGSDHVGYAFEDSKRQIWIITSAGGVDRMDLRTGRIQRYRHSLSDPESISDDKIYCVTTDAAGNIWFGTSKGLNRYDRNKDAFVRYMHDPNDPESLGYDQVVHIYESPREPGILWIGTADPKSLTDGGGLNRFDVASGKFRRYTHDPSNPRSIGSDLVGMIIEDRSGALWIGTGKGLSHFDRQSGVFKTFIPYPDEKRGHGNTVTAICLDVLGRVWITTIDKASVHCFNPADGSFATYTHNSDGPRRLSGAFVHAMFEDSTGVLWIGTELGGLTKINHYGRKFELRSADPRDPAPLSNGLVRSLLVDKSGCLWAGVLREGLNRYSPDRKSVRYFRPNKKQKGALPNGNIWALCEDRAGNVWAGTLGGGLCRFDKASETFTTYSHDPKNDGSISSDYIRVIFEDSEGRLWVGTETAGLNLYDAGSDSFIHFKHDPGDMASIGANAVRAIAQDASGVIWIGTFGGGLNRMIIKLAPGGGVRTAAFKRYAHDPHNPDGISQNLIQSMCADTKGRIWIGTFGGGLDCFDPKHGTFRHFTEQNSDLPNNVIYGVLCDDAGRIWFSSNRGISRCDPETGIIANYDVSDGLQSMEFNGQAAYKAGNGEMFFGGINGYNSFFPDSIIANPNIPRVAVTDFRIFDNPVQVGGDSPLQANILETSEITLPHWQNDVSFTFAALHYNCPSKNRYSYMLVNYDTRWREGSSTRTAAYTNLDPGEYIFRVRAASGDGVWNLEGVSIRLIIRPPWWKTAPAYVAYVVLFLLLLFGIHRIQHRRITAKEREASLLREAELRASMAEAEARAARAEKERVSHELEEARKLQLSLLPRELPLLPDLDIAVHMQTAAEVGGDYYDFLLDENGRLTVAVGDATGHGLSAGTMVSVIKSLFVANVSSSDIRHFFRNCTRILKQLRLGNLYMGLTLVRIERGVVEASAAGMPPIYIYRHNRGEVDVVTMKGMPLGAFDEFAYQDARLDLNPGDTLLIMSDGLPELFNDRREMYDYGRVCDTFRQCGHMQPQEVINTLVSSADHWRNGCLPNDDITFVVLKMKNGPAKAAA